MDEQIDLADFLLIAERVLGIGAEVLEAAARLDAAESALAAPFMGFGDTLFYPDPAQRAAIPTATSALATSACSFNSNERA